MMVDPRVARTREVVLAATIQELAEVGFERISIDAVAERSGVARSTIYRNWPDRTTLLAEAFRQMCATGPADLPPTDDLRADLQALAGLLVEQLQSDLWISAVPSLIGAAGHDEPMRDLMAAFSSERRAESGEIVTRAMARGEIVANDGYDATLERFVAPFFFRRLMSHLPLDEDFVAGQVAAALRELTAQR